MTPPLSLPSSIQRLRILPGVGRSSNGMSTLKPDNPNGGPRLGPPQNRGPPQAMRLADQATATVCVRVPAVLASLLPSPRMFDCSCARRSRAPASSPPLSSQLPPAAAPTCGTLHRATVHTYGWQPTPALGGTQPGQPPAGSAPMVAAFESPPRLSLSCACATTCPAPFSWCRRGWGRWRLRRRMGCTPSFQAPAYSVNTNGSAASLAICRYDAAAQRPPTLPPPSPAPLPFLSPLPRAWPVPLP